MTFHRYQRSSSFHESSLKFWELDSVWVRPSRTFEFLCQMMTWTAFHLRSVVNELEFGISMDMQH